MSQYSQPDETREGEKQATEFHGFHIAPEGGTFLTTLHRYMTTFRHLNCPGYGQQRTQGGVAALDTSEASSSNDCCCIIPLEIPSGYQEPGKEKEEDAVAPRWMEVCLGECNEGAPGEEYNDLAIVNIIDSKAQDLCNDEHLKGAEMVDVELARIAWSETAPLPAYFSPTKGCFEAHSCALTSGHMALVQVRGRIDVIEVDFRTCDHPQVKRRKTGRE